MKILAFADLHGSISSLRKVKKKAKKADIIVCLGDFTIFGDNIIYFMKKINKLGKPVLIIHGNHETRTEVQVLSKGLKNITFMHRKAKVIGDCLFLGYGGGGFSIRDEDFDLKWEKKFKEKIKKNKKVVFMTHQPPYGTNIDLVWDEHCGNKSFRDFYRQNRVDVFFSGHLHETADTIEVVKGTTLINPGPQGIVIDTKEEIKKTVKKLSVRKVRSKTSVIKTYKTATKKKKPTKKVRKKTKKPTKKKLSAKKVRSKASVSPKKRKIIKKKPTKKTKKPTRKKSKKPSRKQLKKAKTLKRKKSTASRVKKR